MPACAATGLEHLGDLHGELAGRHEHQPERAARLGLVDDAGQHRHAEGERLAGAGAGPAADVAALHGERDGLGLDRERLGEPGGGEAVVDRGGHAEVGEAGRRLDGRQRGDGGESCGGRWCRGLFGGGRAARSPPAAGCAPPFERFCHGGCQASWDDVADGGSLAPRCLTGVAVRDTMPCRSCVGEPLDSSVVPGRRGLGEPPRRPGLVVGG